MNKAKQHSIDLHVLVKSVLKVVLIRVLSIPSAIIGKSFNNKYGNNNNNTMLKI